MEQFIKNLEIQNIDKEKINLKKDQAKEYVYRGDKNGE